MLAGTHIFGYPDIKAGGNIHAAGEYIRTGDNITAGGNMSAYEYIRAGGDITVAGFIASNEDVTAGANYGTYVGIDLPLTEQEAAAVVTAKARPENLASQRFKQAAE